MGKEKAHQEILERLDDDPQAISFGSGYTPGAAQSFVNLWGFIPQKLFIVGRNAAGTLYWTVGDQSQWTDGILILRSDIASVTYQITAIP